MEFHDDALTVKLTGPSAPAEFAEGAQDPQVEAVYIALPHHLHAQWSALALQAGKHVLCEKPMALSRAEMAQVAQALVQASAFQDMAAN